MPGTVKNGLVVGLVLVSVVAGCGMAQPGSSEHSKPALRIVKRPYLPPDVIAYDIEDQVEAYLSYRVRVTECQVPPVPLAHAESFCDALDRSHRPVCLSVAMHPDPVAGGWTVDRVPRRHLGRCP